MKSSLLMGFFAMAVRRIISLSNRADNSAVATNDHVINAGSARESLGFHVHPGPITASRKIRSARPRREVR